MKIRFVTASVSRDAGGLFESVRRLAQATASHAHDVMVFGVEDKHTAADIAAWRPVEVKTFKAIGPRRFSFAPRYSAELLSSQGNLVMSHGLWRYTSKATHAWHKKTGLPYIVNPHGMLDPWAIMNSRWKKRIASFLFEDAHLRDAACIRALCESEAQSIRAYGLRNPICVIPNGIDLPVLQDHETRGQKTEDGGRRTEDGVQKFMVRGQWSVVSSPVVAQPVVGGLKADGRKVLLYLGRIHPKKGLVNLLKAWKQVSGQWSVVGGHESEWLLALAGWDEGGHEAELKRLASELEIPWADVRGKTEILKTEMLKGENTQSQEPGAYFSVSESQRFSVLFLGPQFGEAKAACYRQSDAFILPSFSEGLPMTVLEAWSYGKPVLMTPECHLPEGFATEAAVRIGTDVGSVAQALEDLLRTSPCVLRAMGEKGRGLVATRFAWPGIGQEMRSVCEWVLGRGPKPDCVRL
jgi:glycosyltransferase involved in cell wall biosynthesis